MLQFIKSGSANEADATQIKLSCILSTVLGETSGEYFTRRNTALNLILN